MRQGGLAAGQRGPDSSKGGKGDGFEEEKHPVGRPGAAYCSRPLDALCDKLFSGSKSCDEICKSITTGEQFGGCMVCCSNVKGKLDLPY
jgi:hypothetical protein